MDKSPKKSQPRTGILLHLYSLLIAGVACGLRLAAPFSKKVAQFLQNRGLSPTVLAELQTLAASGRQTVLFFCSSAGEFEQAKPLIDRLCRQNQYAVHVLFFSESGIKYAVSRGEKLSYSKAPLDTVWNWNRFFAALNPRYTFVIKYEL